MGLQNYEGGNWITIFEGKFTQKAKEGAEGASSRVNKNDKTVWEKSYDSFTAKLVGIKTMDGAYGKSWVFDFQDAEEIYHLRLSYSSGYAQAFLKMLPNIDVKKEMRLQPQMTIVDGKPKTALFVNQDSKPIKHAFTKENPNGLPPWEQVTVNGVKVWDSSVQLEFLYNIAMTAIVPNLDAPTVVAVETKGLTEADFAAHGTDAQIDKDVDEAF